MAPMQREHYAAGALALLVALAVHQASKLALLALCLVGSCCLTLTVAVLYLARSNERVETLLAVATTSSERISALASGRVDGESAEWANALIAAWLWPKIILPLVERDVQRDVSNKLAHLIEHRKDPDSNNVPDFIENIAVESFSLGAVSPVVTSVRFLPTHEASRAVGLPTDALPSTARVYDLDVAVSSDAVDVVLKATVGGGIVQAIDWVGHVAGALAPKPGMNPAEAAAHAAKVLAGGGGGLAPPPDASASTSLAVHIRRLDFSARMRVAFNTRADVLLMGLMTSPAPRCRMGIDVRFTARAGASVQLPLSRVPGMGPFLEGFLIREMAAAIRWPHALPRDLKPLLTAALTPPGMGLPPPPLPQLEIRATLQHASLSADVAGRGASADADSPTGGPQNPLGAAAAALLRPQLTGPLLCIIGTDSGRRRELFVEILAGAPPARQDVMSVTVTPHRGAMDVHDTLNFVLRRPPDLSRRLGGVRDVAEGLAKVIGDRARAAAAAAAGAETAPSGAPQSVLESPTLGVSKVRLLRLVCGTVLLITQRGASPRLLAITQRGGADDATRARGLEDVSPLPNAAQLDLELYPPGAKPSAPASAILRVRIDLRWTAPGSRSREPRTGE